MRPDTIPAIVRYLLRDEAISGKLIIVATVVALVLANSPFGHVYDDFWHINVTIGFGEWMLSHDLRHWVNEALMSIFFLVVGLEIKREIVEGELGKFQKAILPIAAAFGGMLVPALLYVAINPGGEGFRGWAIPMATDIAFAVGLLALLGRGVPASLKLFLLTLAIVDDIGAILVIALFYGGGLHIPALGVVALFGVSFFVLRKLGWLNIPLFLLMGIGLWLAINAAGIHASIAGALLGLLAPMSIGRAHGHPVTERLERFFIPISALFVIPVFALANTGIALSFGGFDSTSTAVAWGIVAGLVVGKVIGIVGMSWLMIRAGFATLPRGTNWFQMTGVGLLAGIGFTVSIFVTELAFAGNSQLADAAKISIFAASVLSGALGFLVLRGKARHS